MNQISLAASIICADMLSIREQIIELEKNQIEIIHFDVMDGIFVPRYGLCPEYLTSLRKCTSLPIEVHMMTVNPEAYIAQFAMSGATSIIVHSESQPHIVQILEYIRSYNLKVGIAINPDTPLSVLDFLLDNVDCILLMGFNPGVLGQSLFESTYQKITDLIIKMGSRKIDIEIDGGVTFRSATSLIATGADRLVCGSSTIFDRNDSITNNVTKLRRCFESVNLS